MAFLRNRDQIRTIQWGKSYQWDVRFSGNIFDIPPAPFDEFFPALNIEEQLASLNTLDIEAFGTSLKFPQKTNVKSIQITFIDDQDHTLLTWLENWVNDTILNDGNYVSTLDESVKQIIIQKLDNERQNILQTSYWVFPEGPVNFTGNSESEVNQYTMSFVVAGKIG